MKNLLNNLKLSGSDYNELYEDTYSPGRLPIRFNLDKTNKIQDSWEDPWEPKHHNDKYFTYCHRIDCLIEKSIGKPYSEIYSKICNEFPELYDWGTSLKDYFKSRFEPRRYWRGVLEHYYIDEDGLIQFFERENAYKKPKPRIYITDTNRKPSYEVQHQEFQNHSKLMNELFYIIGARKYYQLVDSKEISESFYNEILSKLPVDLHYEFREIVHYMVWRYSWSKGESGYKKVRAETEDAKKKRERENKILREEYKDNLIQYLEWKRKEKELTNDIITRDRHGFDEESFKGEFYHGQKRKKKSA